MIGFITVLIAIIGVLLMAVVLIQNPKGGGRCEFWWSGGKSAFGASNSIDFVGKLTWVLSVASLCTLHGSSYSSEFFSAAVGPALLSQ
ncbi:MAG: preprotein translocase subunit SecG [Saprospiraceae bacterium]|nr:preprotein translocase subunit SecG [Candidatus Brachybacter algidus]